MFTKMICAADAHGFVCLILLTACSPSAHERHQLTDVEHADHKHDADMGDSEHEHGDATGDADDTHMHGDSQPPTGVRLNGACMPLCQTASDPDGDGWGWENDASCLTPQSQLALSLPWCSTPEPHAPYMATPSYVDDGTVSVAVIPRPEIVDVGEPIGCPHARIDLEPWEPAWFANGAIAIPVGKHVLINGNTDIAANVLIETFTVPVGAEVVFADVDASFHIRDFLIEGEVRLGSPTCRLTRHIEFIFDTDEDVSLASVQNDIYARRGLGIVIENTGTLDVFGALYQPTWTRLAQTAVLGTTQIELAEAVDWQPGQQVVLVTSSMRDYPFENQNEVRTLTQVDGTTLTLNAPLSHAHYGGWEYQVEVGLLTRNIVLRTADDVLAAAPTFGGHVLAHGGLVRISSVEAYGLGQQNFIGRYPLHFHHAGDVAYNSYFTDNSIWRSNWRCAVIHRTNRAIVSRNVAYDVFGHCFYLEDGVELDNEVSFNLAARVKIMGPTDSASISALNTYGQEGFVETASESMSNPADRAAAGFYISNGDNRVFGNAASGGFAGYSLPNLPEALGGSTERIVPVSYGASYFDGNTAHTSGYLWNNAGCVYAGGVLQMVDGELQYLSGRPPSWLLERQGVDAFSNIKTFLCTVGLTHWGRASRLVNFEAWDNELLAKLFGTASIDAAMVVGETGNASPLGAPLLTGYRRGFQFYDTWTLTLLRDVLLKNIHATPDQASLPSQDNCAFFSMTHSDQYTPQRMSATARIYFDDVDDSQRFCHDNTGTLSSRNFNVLDTDGTATSLAGDVLPNGPRIVGSAYSDVWHLSDDCVRNATWGLWLCPQRNNQNVAAISVLPHQGVQVTVYNLDGSLLGDNWYASDSEYPEAQITAPSNTGWHHAFPNGVPDSFGVYAMQVPQDGFVILSFSLPSGVTCSVEDVGFSAASDLPALLSATGPVYVTQNNTCFVRIPPVDAGIFEGAGLSIPRQAWSGMSAISNFTVVTGCNGSSACTSVVSSLPAW